MLKILIKNGIIAEMQAFPNGMKKLIKIKRNRGMSYVELIVVLSIFSVMTSVVIFNYGDFQAKVDIKNLSSEIALKVVEAQKSSLSGKLPVQAPIVFPWKPSYGLYFDVNPVANNKTFIYFTDLDNNRNYNSSPDCPTPGTGECMDNITITKGNYISSLDVFYQDDSTDSLDDLTITYVRPNSGATIKSSQIPLIPPPLVSPIDYVQITISSPKTATSKIQIYPSGRIQVN